MIDLEYIEIDGLLYPNIETGMESIENALGKYGILRLRYLHEYKQAMYRKLLLTGELPQYCVDVDMSAFDLYEKIRGQYLAAHPASAADTVARIQAFTQADAIADEIVKSDLIYR